MSRHKRKGLAKVRAQTHMIQEINNYSDGSTWCGRDSFGLFRTYSREETTCKACISAYDKWKRERDEITEQAR